MSPLLQPGDEVFVDPRAYRHTLPHPGDIVVAQHPYTLNLKIVKRVIAVTKDGYCQLEGDNTSESSDSRSFGTVPTASLLGRVTSRFV